MGCAGGGVDPGSLTSQEVPVTDHPPPTSDMTTDGIDFNTNNKVCDLDLN